MATSSIISACITLPLLLTSLVYSSIIVSPAKEQGNGTNSILKSNCSEKALDFVFPDSPLLTNVTLNPAIIVQNLNISTEYSYEDEDDKIGGNAIATILG